MILVDLEDFRCYQSHPQLQDSVVYSPTPLVTGLSIVQSHPLSYRTE